MGLYPVPTPMDVVDYDKPLKSLARSIAFDDPMTGQARIFVTLPLRSGSYDGYNALP